MTMCQTKTMQNQKVIYLKIKKGSNSSPKRAFRFNKRALLLNKKTLGKSRRTGEG